MQVNTILQGDALAMLRTLPAESVQCVVTSPPYYGLRNYNVDGQIGLEETPVAYVAKLVEVFREVRRVLKDDGTFWLNLGDSYANDAKWGGSTSGKHVQALHGKSAARDRRVTGLRPKNLLGIPWRVAFGLQDDGWILRSDIIWEKGNVMPESVTDRPTKSHEYLFLLAKSERYYYCADAIREQHATESNVRNRAKESMWASNALLSPIGEGEREWNHPNGRNKRSVWTVNTQPFNGAKLLADYVGEDGKPYKVSLDCPIHGRLRGSGKKQKGVCDARPIDASSRNFDTANDRGLELQAGLYSRSSRENQDLQTEIDVSRIAGNIHESKSGVSDEVVPQNHQDIQGIQETRDYSPDCSHPSNSQIAIGHSMRNHKTDLVPGTNPACMPSAQTPSHTGDMSALPLWSELSDHTHESNTLQDDRNAHTSVQTQYRKSHNFEANKDFSCKNGNTAICTCQQVMVDHFAVMPPKLVEPCILAGSRPGDVVLDPFMGSGTVAQVAVQAGRQYLGVELNPTYIELARKRLSTVQVDLWQAMTPAVSMIANLLPVPEERRGA